MAPQMIGKEYMSDYINYRNLKYSLVLLPRLQSWSVKTTAAHWLYILQPIKAIQLAKQPVRTVSWESV